MSWSDVRGCRRRCEQREGLLAEGSKGRDALRDGEQAGEMTHGVGGGPHADPSVALGLPVAPHRGPWVEPLGDRAGEVSRPGGRRRPRAGRAARGRPACRSSRVSTAVSRTTKRGAPLTDRAGGQRSPTCPACRGPARARPPRAAGRGLGDSCRASATCAADAARHLGSRLQRGSGSSLRVFERLGQAWPAPPRPPTSAARAWSSQRGALHRCWPGPQAR